MNKLINGGGNVFTNIEWEKWKKCRNIVRKQRSKKRTNLRWGCWWKLTLTVKPSPIPGIWNSTRATFCEEKNTLLGLLAPQNILYRSANVRGWSSMAGKSSPSSSHPSNTCWEEVLSNVKVTLLKVDFHSNLHIIATKYLCAPVGYIDNWTQSYILIIIYRDHHN